MNSVATVMIQFSETVKNFDLADLSLMRDGKAVSLSAASLSSNDCKTWILGKLDSLTGAAGNYQLTLVPCDITDQVGEALVAGANDAWQVSSF